MGKSITDKTAVGRRGVLHHPMILHQSADCPYMKG